MRERYGVLSVLVLGSIVLCLCQRPAGLTKRHDVYIAGFFPYARKVAESRLGRGVMPAVKLAVDHINDCPTVLRNYRLHMWWNDTECNTAVGVKAFFDMMHDLPHKVMLFGAACTQVTDPIAKASKHWHLTQLSYADTHPMFTSAQFPNFFRVVPSENAFNKPRLSLLTHFNWSIVGTIYQNEPRYSLAHNRLVAELDKNNRMNFTVVETQSFATEVGTAIRKLQEKDVRIILGNFNESWARRIFCEAYRVGMVGRKYQWLIMGTYSPNWWKAPETNCSIEELEASLDGVILTDFLPLATSREITISGVTADEYKLEYDSRRGTEYSRFHGYTYDGMWAAALAIQHAAHRIRHFRKNQTLVDFRYRDPLWERLFLDALRNTSFEGVTGPVRFYDNERKASILLKQFQNGEEVKVGEYNGVTEHLDLTQGRPIHWGHGKGPPKDRTLTRVERSHVNLAIFLSLAITASCGIFMAVGFLVINIKFRNQKYIKMSSPHLNNLIIVGCILTYSSVIFLGLDSTLTSTEVFPYICTARASLLMTGFSLAFGAMFSKTWRVHSIFTDVKLNKKVIKDYQLFFVVGFLLSLDFVIMITWQAIDPFFREIRHMEPYPQPNSEDIMIVPENESCNSSRMTTFVFVIYAYKGLLMAFGAFLAWETRHVSIPALNDSKYVGMSVYNVVLMCIMGAAISFVLSDQHEDVSFIIISLFIIFCTTATLCLVFVPKVVELRRNPQGSIDKRIRATLRPMSSKMRRDSSELEEKVREAKQQNQQWRKIIMERDNEMQSLLRQLGPAEERLHQPPLSVSNQEVSQLRREPPSGTETTDISSICSVTSSHDGEANATETPAPRRKSAICSNKIPSISVDDMPPPAPTLSMINENTYNGNEPPSLQIMQTSQSPKHYSSLHRDKASPHHSKPHLNNSSSSVRRRSSLCKTASPQVAHTGGGRRTSMPAQGQPRQPPTYVLQDELWMTQRNCRSRCILNYSPSDDEEVSMIHRSVSERRNGKIKGHDSKALKKPTPGHVQSTPNVLSNAVSEGEILDLAILPIFQKLLTDRHGAAIASCPNIAIKCDIVEYL